MRLPLTVYDCFTSVRFGGNVGAIVWDAAGIDEQAMQSIAREVNAPVTGFVTQSNAEAVSVRFFMPTMEIAMCGHVTVGLYTHLFETGVATTAWAPPMRTRSGEVAVELRATADGPEVMLAAAAPKRRVCAVDQAALSAVLGVGAEAISDCAPIEAAEAGLSHLFVPIRDAETLDAMTPDFNALSAFSQSLSVATVACYTLAPNDASATLACRDFCPAVGVDEVPASGTTNAALAGLLAPMGVLGAVDAAAVTVVAEQGTRIGRPSRIKSEVELAEGAVSAIRVGGQAVATIDGWVQI